MAALLLVVSPARQKLDVVAFAFGGSQQGFQALFHILWFQQLRQVLQR